jgi:hypothetical protein
VVFDHDGPLEHRTYPNLLTVDHRVKTAADLVVEGWDDAGQRNEINDLAHVVASLVAADSSRVNKKAAEPKSAESNFTRSPLSHRS